MQNHRFKETLRFGLLALCGALAFLCFTTRTFATPYASEVTNVLGFLSFYLNEVPSSVTITFENGATTNLSSPGVGQNLVNLGAHTSFAIAVTKYGSGTPTQLSADTNQFCVWNSPRGVAVTYDPTNGNAFGRIYVDNSAAGGIGLNAKGKGIYMLNQDFSVSVFGNGTNALTTGRWNAGSSSSPYRMHQQPDGTLLVADYATASATVWQFNSTLTSSNQLLADISETQGVTDGVHGDFFGQPILTGSIATSNLTLWTVDTGLPVNGGTLGGSTTLGYGTANGNYNNINKYFIGSGPLPTTGWDAAPNLSINVGIPTISELNIDVAIEPVTGNVYGMFDRNNFAAPSLQVFAPNGASKLFDSLVASGGILNSNASPLLGGPDILESSFVLAISPDGKYVATVTISNEIIYMAITNGLPDVATLQVIPNGPSAIDARGICFDAADNIYAVSSGQGVLREYSLGLTTTCITSNDTTYGHGSFQMLSSTYASPYTFTTFAGQIGTSGTNDGTGNTAQFDYPGGIAVDTNGNSYVADTDSQTIRKITAAGVVTTLAGTPHVTGSNDGTNGGAQFYFPLGVAVDSSGFVYVADENNCTIRKISATGVVTTLAGMAQSTGTNDGTGSGARFDFPIGVAVDANSNIYVADTGNTTIRKVTASGVVTTLAGSPHMPGTNDGINNGARFNSPYFIAVDRSGNLYVTDEGSSTIRKLTPSGTNWVVTTIAGLGQSTGAADGLGSAARFDFPVGMAVDNSSNIYVTDEYNATVRKISPAGTNWMVTTLAGLAQTSGTNDGTGMAARFDYPDAVGVDANSNIYVADSVNQTIRKGTPGAAPVIIAAPVSLTTTNGGAVAFSLTVGGSFPMSYQWLLNGTNIPTATNWILNISNLVATNSGIYEVMASNNYGTISSIATLSIPTNPVITWTSPPPIVYGTPLGTNQLNAQASVPGVFTYTPSNGAALNTGTYFLSAVFTPSDLLTYNSSTNTVTLTVSQAALTITVANAARFPLTTNPIFTGVITGVTNGDNITANYFTSATSNSPDGTYPIFPFLNDPGNRVSNYSETVYDGILTITNFAILQPIYPQVINEQAGDHVAFQTSATGTGTLYYQWYQNYIPIPSQTNTTLVLTNIQPTNTGTYTVTVVDNSGIYVSNTATLNVSSNPIPLISSNVVVVRVGDGVQTLSISTGNTIYLDQYTGAGVYVSSLMIPDESTGLPYGTGSSASVVGSPALLLSGTGGYYGGMLSLSYNKQFLTLGAYCANYPYSGLNVMDSGATHWRGLATISANGVYNLAYTNRGLYTVLTHDIRSAFTLEGLNFWMTGGDFTNGLEFINVLNNSYANGSGIPAIGTSSELGTQVVQAFGTNLVYSDSQGAAGQGLYVCAGFPEPGVSNKSTTASLLLNEGGTPEDFAISPDGRTVYITDTQAFTGKFNQAGGIQRWDTNTSSGGYMFSYTLSAMPTGGIGALGLTASFSTNIGTWGSNVTGAILYVTSTSNTLSLLVDEGPSTIPTVFVNAAPYNELLRGVRFGPLTLPKVTPVFTSLTAAPTSVYGATSLTLSGKIFAPGPIYPANGESLTVTINGNVQTAMVNDSTGDFSINYNPATLPANASPYTVQYSYGGDTMLFSASDSSTSLTVTQAPVTILSGVTVNNKTYDGTTSASLISNNMVLGGVLPGDAANVTVLISAGTATFAGKDVANGITVNVSGLPLFGSASGNYTLVPPTFSGNITAKNLNMTGLSVPASKPYDGTTTAVVSGTPALLSFESAGAGSTSDGKPYIVDIVNLTGVAIGTYNNPNVATATAVTYSGLSLGGAQASDYNLVIESPASATIVGAPLGVTANNQTKLYGQTLTFGSGSTNFFSGGLRNGETIGSVTLGVSSNGGAALAPVGVYTITPSAATGGTFNPANYLLSYTTGTLTVSNYTQPYTFITLAGIGQLTGTNDGAGSTARFNFPHGVALDAAGNLYVADVSNETIRVVTPAGTVTTIAGQANTIGTNDGTGSAATFHFPIDVAVDSATNLYVADYSNNKIRKISPSGTNWIVTTLAGGGTGNMGGYNDAGGTAALFHSPTGLAVDAAGNVYVADAANYAIRMVTPSGQVTTLAGTPGVSGSNDGVGTNSQFYSPVGVAVDGATNLYVADINNATIRKVSPMGTNWMVTTLAGTAGSTGSNDGVGNAARFFGPSRLALDHATNLYLIESGNDEVREISPVGTNWIVSTLGGTPTMAGTNDGIGTAALFNKPTGIAVNSAGILYVGDSGNDTIRAGYPPTPPVILTNPPANISLTYTNGGSVSFTVIASGAPPLSYQWKHNGFTLADGTSISGTISGSQSNVLTLTNLTVNGAGTYQVTITNAFGSTNATSVLSVAQALSIVTWSNPAPITYGTALTSNQLNATANVPGAFVYSPVSGSVLTAGTNLLSVSFTPTDSIDYAGSGTNVSLIVLPVPLTVTAANTNRFAGQTNPIFTGTITGATNGDVFTANYSCAATVFSSAGAYPILPVVNPNSKLTNYTLTLVNGTLTVGIQVAPVTNTVTKLAVPRYLTSQGGSLFMTGLGTNAAGGIFSAPIGGSTQTKLFSAVNPQQIAVVGANVYWIDSASSGAGYTQILKAATNGTGSVSALPLPQPVPIVAGSGLDTDGSTLYAADGYSGSVWRLNPSGSGLLQLGNNRYPDNSTNVDLNTIAVSQGIIYLADSGGGSIPPQVVSIATNGSVFSTLCSGAPLVSPSGIAVSTNGTIFVADPGAGNTVWVFAPKSGTPVPFLSGAPFVKISGLAYVNNTLYVADSSGGAIYAATLTVPVIPSNTAPVITWTTPSPITYGTPLSSAQLDPMPNAAGTFTFSPTNGAVLNAGTQTLTAVFTPSNTNLYLGATNTVSLVITPAPLSVTAANVSRLTNQLNPTFTAQYVGLQNGDTFSTTFVTTGANGCPAGNYPIVPTVVGSAGALANYIISTNSGILTVGAVMAWTPPATILYGTALGPSQLNATANVTGAFVYTPPAGTVLNTGTYPISVTYTPADSFDYGGPIVSNLSLKVNAPTLLVTAANASRIFGLTNPAFVDTVVGLQNGDAITVTNTCVAVTNSPPGTYAIVPSLVDPGNRQTNYNVVLVNGTLSVTELPTTNYSEAYTFTTLAGYPGFGSADGIAPQFNNPSGVAVDTNGNIYVADTDNDTIRMISPSGVASTIAGSVGDLGTADGIGNEAQFNFPSGIALDAQFNIYVADSYNSTIRMINQAGVVSTLAGTAGINNYADATGTNALFNDPAALAVDAHNNIYVADTDNDVIRKIAPQGTNWVVTTVAGLARVAGSIDAAGANARFDHPSGIAVDTAGNIYVADSGNNTIRMINSDNSVVTIAGQSGRKGTSDGQGVAAQFNYPYGLAIDGSGNLYVGDMENDTVREISPGNWNVTTLAGTAGISGSRNAATTSASFNGPAGVAVGGKGFIYVADANNALIRVVTSAGAVTTVAGLIGGPGSADGPGSDARFDQPLGTAVDSSGNIFVADSYNHTIRRITSAGEVSTFAGSSGTNGFADGVFNQAQFFYPDGVAVDASGNVYVADTGNYTIRMITPAQVVTTIAGSATNSGYADEIGTNALFGSPTGVAVDSSGHLYVADSLNQVIREVSLEGTNWVVTTLAGQAGVSGTNDGTGTSAQFSNPFGIAVDTNGNLYVTDQRTNTIRKITQLGSQWVVSTIAGSPGPSGSGDTPPKFARPEGIAVDAAGNIFVTDTGNYTIRKIEPDGTNYDVHTIGGLAGAQQGSTDGTGTDARFYNPGGIAVSSNGTIYVGDTGNNTIRKGLFTQYVSANNVIFTNQAMDGQLMVLLPGANGQGQWRFVLDQVWHNSGELVTNLAEGDYYIECSVVPGYMALPVTAPMTVGHPIPYLYTNQYYAIDEAQDTNALGTLTVVIEPSPPVGAGWFFLSTTNQTNVSGYGTALLAGTYFIGFAPVNGYSTPPNLSVQVADQQASVIQVTYTPSSQPPPSGVSLPVPVPSASISNLDEFPFGFNGQLLTDVGSGSGVLVQRDVVLTAAHLVFNDQTLSYVTEANWLYEKEAGVFDPAPLQPRGWYILSDYAAQRTNDLTGGLAPDQASPQSQNFDVAALYFGTDVAGGGYGGYLPSDEVPNQWLASTANKLLVGYPVDGSQFAGVTNIVSGMMYETGPQHAALTLSASPVNDQQVYTTPWILSFPGNSGGPFCVEFNGYYYPAGVYLGTIKNGTVPYESAIRAIDSNVVNMIALAALAGSSRSNFVGAGVLAITAANQITSPNTKIAGLIAPPAAVQAGAGWGASVTGPFVAGNPFLYTVSASTQLYFEPVTHWNLPLYQAVTSTNGTILNETNYYTVMVASAPVAITYGSNFTTNLLHLGVPAITNHVTNNIIGSFTYSPAVGSLINSGTYPVTVTFTPADTNDYGGPSVTNVNLVIAPAPLIVTASNLTWYPGLPFPTSFGGTLVGLTNNDNISVTFTCNATASSNIGTYSITPVLNDPTHRLTNYTITTNLGIFTITEELVQNGGFETGTFSSWTLSGNAVDTGNDFTSSVYIVSGTPVSEAAYIHSGQHGAALDPDGPLGFISQSLPTTAGQLYLLSLWLYCDGYTSNQFLVSWNGTNAFSQTNLPALGWTNLQFAVKATKSSTALQIGSVDDNSSFGLDDVSVRPFPSLAFPSVSHTGSAITFTWNTFSNATYEIQSATNLSSTNWTVVGSIINTGNNVTATTNVPINASKQQFYRVVFVP